LEQTGKQPLCAAANVPLTWPGINNMSKSNRTNREPKKQAILTPKEKKAAKRLKKQNGDSLPFSIKDS
jgi:hypothetical protein